MFPTFLLFFLSPPPFLPSPVLTTFSLTYSTPPSSLFYLACILPTTPFPNSVSLLSTPYCSLPGCVPPSPLPVFFLFDSFSVIIMSAHPHFSFPSCLYLSLLSSLVVSLFLPRRRPTSLPFLPDMLFAYPFSAFFVSFLVPSPDLSIIQCPITLT